MRAFYFTISKRTCRGRFLREVTLLVAYVPRRWRTFPVRRQKPAATFISLIASSYAGYRRNPKKRFYTDEAINYTIEINHPSFVRGRDKKRRCAGLTGMPPPVVCSDLSIKKAPTTVSNPLPFAASLFARKTLFSTFHKGFSKLVEPRVCDLKPSSSERFHHSDAAEIYFFIAQALEIHACRISCRVISVIVSYT